jgi:crossover junction endodeoxyribonuclease RuvC
MSIVLGIDPGFSNIGIAVVDTITMSPKKLLLFTTEKSSKKSNVLATGDNFRRSKEIYVGIKQQIVEWSPKVLALESMSFPRNASVAAKMAYAWGVVAAIASETGIPVVQVTPQGLKKHLTDKNNASKEEIQEALFNKYGEALLLEAGLNDIAKGGWEHPLDALGAVLAASKSEIFSLINTLEK